MNNFELKVKKHISAITNYKQFPERNSLSFFCNGLSTQQIKILGEELGSDEFYIMPAERIMGPPYEPEPCLAFTI